VVTRALSITRPAVFGFCLVMASFLSAGVAAAEVSSNVEAKKHFQLGVELNNRERYDLAADQFQRAYELSRDYRYLYNLGLTYVWRWKPVEASECFQRYLREGGTRISAERRAIVEKEIARQRSRIAWLELDVTPAEVEVRIDGKSIGKSPFDTPLALTGGPHTVSAVLDGYDAEEREVSLRVEEREPVRIALKPLPPPPARRGRIAIDCPIPGVRVVLDGSDAGLTPLAEPVLALEGTRAVELWRDGYAPQRTLVRVAEAGVARVECTLPLLPSPNAAASGRLELSVSERGADILIDSRPAKPASVVPAGPHALEVRRYGFEPWRSSIQVRAGATERVSVLLVPTRAYLEDYRQRALIRRNWAYGTGAAGVAAVATAAGLAIWNANRYSNWEDENAFLERAYQDPSSDFDELERRREAANDLLDSVHSVDTAVAVTGAAGGVLLLGAAVLYLGGDNPSRYDRTQLRGRVTPTGADFALRW
jgi:hypothetical protein